MKYFQRVKSLNPLPNMQARSLGPFESGDVQTSEIYDVI